MKTRKLRILMLAQSYAPHIGGEERMVQDLSHELSARGHEVHVATLSPDSAPNDGPVRVHRLGSTVYRLPISFRDEQRRHAAPAPDPETVRDLGRVARAVRPDIVHAHNWLAHSYAPLRRPLRRPFLMSLHDYALRCATKRLFWHSDLCEGPQLLKCAECASHQYGHLGGPTMALSLRASTRWLRSSVDMFLPISEAVRDGSGLNPTDRFRIVPNLFRPSQGPAAKDARLDSLPDRFVLFFGDATVDKGARHLADAYQQLRDPPALIFLGRPLIPGLAADASVRTIGPVPHELAMEVVRRSLLVVVPSLWAEPFGLVALEAAAAGKAVIASDVGGLRTIVDHEESGLLIPRGDVRALAMALQRLLDDETLRNTFGSRARIVAQRFAAPRIVPMFERAYLEAMGEL